MLSPSATGCIAQGVPRAITRSLTERWRLAGWQDGVPPPALQDSKHPLVTRRRGRHRASRRDASAPVSSCYARRSANALSIAASIISIHMESAGIGAMAELTTVFAEPVLFAGVGS